LNSNRIVITVGGIIALTIFLCLDMQQYLTLAALKSNRQNLEDYYAAHKLTILVSFMVVYIFQTALFLPGAAILSMAAGAIFGTAIGVICVIIAATLGAVLAFLATRYMFRDAVMKRFGSRLEGINKELEDRGFNYLLFLRLVPLFPFFMINLAAGLTRLPLRTFIIGTMLGIIPGGFVYVNAGANLASVDSLSGIASPKVMISLSLLGLFVLLPVLYNKICTRKCSP
jgi:uncharacterized membrane protein YdjX (TVP38/TMEM64 family)